MGKKIVYFFVLLFLPYINRCGTTNLAPVKILELNAFYIDYNSGNIGFYINWVNQSKNRIIDSIEISISSELGSEELLCYRILEPAGIYPGENNHNRIFTIDKEELPLVALDSLSVIIKKVSYTDGQVWKSGQTAPITIVKIDGSKGKGTFPVKLMEAIFFQQQDQYLQFHTEWTNNLRAEDIINVVYKITAKTSYGTIIPGEDGKDMMFVTENYINSEHIRPGESNYISQNYIYNNIFDQSDKAAIYEIAICKAVDSKGIVWENKDEEDRILVIFNGKKGYCFEEYLSNKSVQKLINRIADSTLLCGLELNKPEVYIKEQQYCILRYADVDVRVNLSKDNKVQSDNVEMFFYADIPTKIEGFCQPEREWMELLRLCICTAVLTDLSYADVEQIFEEYDQKSGNTSFFIDSSYKIFEKNIFINDKYLTPIWSKMYLVGKGLEEPSSDFVLGWTGLFE